VFKIITTDFLDDMNDKLHTQHTSIYIPNCTLMYIYRNLYHSNRTDLQLIYLFIYTYIFMVWCLIN